MLNKIIISCPFGNYLNFNDTTSTLGTFTLYPRPGRVWRTLATVRYNWRQQSWINKIGLRNPGIKSIDESCRGGIISIHGFNKMEWDIIVSHLIFNHYTNYIELNLSCPNVGVAKIGEVEEAICRLIKGGYVLIAKLPPIQWLEWGKQLVNLGVKWFHLCNTIPTPGGGISGKPLKQYSLWAIHDFRSLWGGCINIIGGGGITSIQDIQDYHNAGANYYSIGSALFNPLNWLRIKNFVKVTNDPEEDHRLSCTST